MGNGRGIRDSGLGIRDGCSSRRGRSGFELNDYYQDND